MNTRTRSVTGFIAAALVAGATFFGAGAPAGAAAGYRGSAHAAIVHVDALTLGTTRVADAEVGTSGAQVDSTGLKRALTSYRRSVVPNPPASATSGANSSIVEAGVVLSPPDTENQVKPFTSTVFAPGDAQTVDKSLLNQAIGPVAFADVIRNTAVTRANNTCVIGAPIALGRERIAQVDALETADDATTPVSDGFDKPVVGIDAGTGAARRGAAEAVSYEQIYSASGRLGLWSASVSTIAPVTLLRGTTNEFQIEVGGPAFLVARANGGSGGAAIDFHVPLITIVQGGKSQTLLPQSPVIIRQPVTGDALAQIKIGVAEALPSSGLGNATTSAAGTLAAAQANVVEVTLLDAVSQNLRGATIGIGHLEASSSVPAGGITCPIPVTKVADPPSVNVGSTFATKITVHNEFSCPLTGVTLVDDITTESDALFEVVSSDPAAASAPGGDNLDHGTVKWSIGSLKAGESKTVTLVLRAEGGAGKIVDTATATGTLANCDVTPGGAGADVSGLGSGSVGVVGSATLVEPASKVLGVKIRRPAAKPDSLAFTGLDDRGLIATGLGLLALAVMLGFFTRRGETFDELS